MSNKKTIKALEELVKTEYMAIAALDAATEEVDDNKLRKQYRKFRDQHSKQAEALNDRLEDLGGEPLTYEVGTGKGQGGLWGKITGMRDDSSVEGMRVGAERGIKRYIDHIDEVEDAKALNIPQDLENSRTDAWYDDQASKERAQTWRQVETSRTSGLRRNSARAKKTASCPASALLWGYRWAPTPPEAHRRLDFDDTAGCLRYEALHRHAPRLNRLHITSAHYYDPSRATAAPYYLSRASSSVRTIATCFLLCPM